VTALWHYSVVTITGLSRPNRQLESNTNRTGVFSPSLLLNFPRQEEAENEKSLVFFDSACPGVRTGV
jgi:hypothetical protein